MISTIAYSQIKPSLQSLFVQPIIDLGSLMFCYADGLSKHFLMEPSRSYLLRRFFALSIINITSFFSTCSRVTTDAVSLISSIIKFTSLSTREMTTTCNIRRLRAILTNLHNVLVANIIDLGSLMFGRRRFASYYYMVNRCSSATAVLSYQVYDDHQQLHGFSRKRNHKCEKHYSFSHNLSSLLEARLKTCNIRLPKSIISKEGAAL